MRNLPQLRLSLVPRRLSLGLATLLLGLAPACIDGRGGEGFGGGGANASEQRECKDACDQLKFFDCADSSDHASCFAACEQATASAIDLFVSCVQTDICDPSCVNDLVQAAEPPPGGEGGEGAGGGDDDSVGAGSCVDACEAFVADGCIEGIDCGAACALLPADDRNFLVYCEARREGCTLPSECSDVVEPGPDSAGACQDGCDSLLFFDCIDPAQHSSCRTLCGTVDADARETFAACAENGICVDAACYEVLEDAAAGGGGGAGEDGGAGEG